MPRILPRKPPGNWTNILDGNGRRSIYRYCLLVPIFKKMYGVRCWKYPMDRRFLTERWLDGSDCRMLSVRWRMRMEQMQYPSLLLVIGLSGVIDRLRDTAAGSKQKIFVGIGTGKNARRISLFFIKVNISDIGKFGYFCGVKM